MYIHTRVYCLVINTLINITFSLVRCSHRTVFWSLFSSRVSGGCCLPLLDLPVTMTQGENWCMCIIIQMDQSVVKLMIDVMHVMRVSGSPKSKNLVVILKNIAVNY